MGSVGQDSKGTLMKFRKSNKIVAAGVVVAVLAGLGTALALESTGSNDGAAVMMNGAGDQQWPQGDMPQDRMRDGDHEGDDHHGPRGMGPMVRLDIVASTLGISEADVQSAIADGKTLAELADANGSSAQELIDALVAEVKAHFDAEVASGEHTQADADARIADATAAITEFVNNTQEALKNGPAGFGDPDGDHGPMGGGMGSGMGGGMIDAGPTDATTTTTAG